MIYALWRYRAFIFSSAKREFNSRYLGSKIGFVWSLIHPLVLILIYTLVFSEIMRARLPGLDDKLAFGIYLCAGVLTWNLFSEIITRSQTIFLKMHPCSRSRVFREFAFLRFSSSLRQ